MKTKHSSIAAMAALFLSAMPAVANEPELYAHEEPWKPWILQVLGACKHLSDEALDQCAGAEADKFAPALVPLDRATVADAARRLAGEMERESQRHKVASLLAEEKSRRSAECKKRGLKFGDVRIGMRQATVKSCGWGLPASVNKTITAARTTEQWIYPFGYLYFTNGVLTAIQY